MNTTITKPMPKKVSALAVMAARVNMEPQKLHETLKNTVFKGANDHELVALVLVANEYKLNPLVKQIYAFPQKGGGVVPVVGIDGWLKIINEHPQFDGLETEDIRDDNKKLLAVECRIFRKDRSRPTIIREYLSECIRKTDPWQTMPQRMLRHKAIMQCARIAFSIAGIVDEDDAGRVGERAVSGAVVDDPMTAAAPVAKEEPETLTLDASPESPRERLGRIANEKGLPVEALIVEAAEGGAVDEKAVADYTDEEITIICQCYAQKL